jgi:hypothetical protein
MNMKQSRSTLFALDRILFSMALAFLGPISLVPNASAASLIYDPSPPDNCTTALNCGAVILNGISMKNEHADSIPFTGEHDHPFVRAKLATGKTR